MDALCAVNLAMEDKLDLPEGKKPEA